MGSALSRSLDSKEERDAHFASPLAFSRASSSSGNSDTYRECRSLLSNIKGHPTHKAQLIGLEGEDAQDVVDFLSIVCQLFICILRSQYLHDIHAGRPRARYP